MLGHAPLGTTPVGASADGERYLDATLLASTNTFPDDARLYMLVTLRPVSDVDAGDWTRNDGSSTELYLAINETIPDDEDYIQSRELEAEQSSSCIIKLANAADPNESINHTVDYRFEREGELTPMSMIVSLMQGSETIASWTHENVADIVVQARQTLTEMQTDAITDYSDLRLKFEAVGA